MEVASRVAGTRKNWQKIDANSLEHALAVVKDNSLLGGELFNKLVALVVGSDMQPALTA